MGDFISSIVDAMVGERQKEHRDTRESKALDPTNPTFPVPLAPERPPSDGPTLDPLTENDFLEITNSFCFSNAPGASAYRGHVGFSSDRLRCQKWTSQFPNTHSTLADLYPNKGLGAHAYCRLPDGASSPVRLAFLVGFLTLLRDQT